MIGAKERKAKSGILPYRNSHLLFVLSKEYVNFGVCISGMSG